MGGNSRSEEAAKYRLWYKLARWKRLRLRQLSSEPFCRMCRKDGKITVAEVCDHVVPHRGNPKIFWGGPFQSLCKRCHDNFKQIEEVGKRVAIGADGWPLA